MPKSAVLNLTPIPRGSFTREDHGRMTMAWYFRPPVVDESGRAFTGLPEDCFYTTSSWMETQVTRQTNKGAILVMDVEMFGGKVNGAPITGLRRIDHNEDSQRRWGRICKALSGAREQELEMEKRTLARVEDNLQYALADPNLREQLVERKDALAARIERLEAGVDFKALKDFFNEEAANSARSAQSQRIDIRSMVDQAVDARMATATVAG